MEKEYFDLKDRIEDLEDRMEKLEKLFAEEDISKLKATNNVWECKDVEELNNYANSIIEIIDRTQHLIIFKFKDSQDIALYIFRLAKNNGYIGLIPYQISDVLKNKFQINISSDTLQKALNRAKEYIDRRKFPKKIGRFQYYYIISEKGLSYLNDFIRRLEDE